MPHKRLNLLLISTDMNLLCGLLYVSKHPQVVLSPWAKWRNNQGALWGMDRPYLEQVCSTAPPKLSTTPSCALPQILLNAGNMTTQAGIHS